MGYEKASFEGMLDNGTTQNNASFIITEHSVICRTESMSLELRYEEIGAFTLENYRINIKTETGMFSAFRLGIDTEEFYMKLWRAYNAMVLKSLFVNDEPILEAQGDFTYADAGGEASGKAIFELFERSLCILPPNTGARRIPLVFVQEIRHEGYKSTIILDTGETYELAKLGADTGPFQKKLQGRIDTIRLKSQKAVSDLDKSLDAEKSRSIATLMPEGACAPIGSLKQISPAYVGIIEGKIKESRAAETYDCLKELCVPDDICIGMKSYLAGEDNENIIWIAAPHDNGGGGVAAVEYALSEESSAATYFYRYKSDWNVFWRRLNHAMEMIDFQREVIMLSDEDIQKEKLYKMALQRIISLEMLRQAFCGRAVHRSVESWMSEAKAIFGY